MVTDKGIRATNEKLKAALEARKRPEQAANPDREQLARDMAEHELLLAQVFAIPDQAERRRLLDLAGLNNVSAAPRPIEPIRQASRTEAPQRSPHEPRWSVWLALPKLKLWQCVALSLGIEPTDHIEASMRNGRQVNSRFMLGVPGEFFDRLDVCKQALSTEGPIVPQGPLYRGILSDSGCPVLLKDVAAFLRVAAFEVPAPLADLPQSKPPERTSEIVQRDSESDHKQKKWTDERLNELARFRKEHGTKKAAEKFEISEARVRQLLPSEDAQPTGYSAFNQRTNKP